MFRWSLVAAVVATAALVAPAAAADAPYVGSWKIAQASPFGDSFLLIASLTEKDGAPQVELVSTPVPQFNGAKVKAERLKDGRLRVEVAGSLTIRLTVVLPKGDAKPETLIGLFELQGQRSFTRFERTDAKELTRAQVNVPNPATADFRRASTEKDVAALKGIAEKHKDTLLGFQANLALLALLPAEGAKDDEVKAIADKALAQAAAYGPEVQEGAVLQAAQQLVASKKGGTLAVALARQAEEMLAKDAKALQKVAILKTLRSALDQAGKKDEAKDVGQQIAKLDKVVDDEYLKDAVPFPTEPYVRKGKGKTALVELFTGAQCPPCVAADVAFDAALKTYKPADVILLQYHLHIPGPDALTNDDTEARSKFYNPRGVPSTYLNGKTDLPLGGPKANGKASFDELAKAIDTDLTAEGDAAPKIALVAQRKDETITIVADVTNIKNPGEDVKLRIALVEEMVRYPGGNGQRFHHHVVRAMPGGVDGTALKEATAKKEVTVQLGDLRKTLTDYLEKANARRPFREDDRPMELKDLKVVAFVQNDKTKEVLQAVQVDLH